MMELGSADLVSLCFCLFLETLEENQFRFCFRLRSFVFREPLGRVPFSTTRVFETLFSLN